MKLRQVYNNGSECYTVEYWNDETKRWVTIPAINVRDADYDGLGNVYVEL
jgi:hypothetical protein